MKPTDLFEDLNDFQEHTSGLTPDTTYAQLGPSITTIVNTTVLPMVTAAVYIALANAQPDPEPTQTPDSEDPTEEIEQETQEEQPQETQEEQPQETQEEQPKGTADTSKEVLLEGKELLKNAVAAGAMLQYQIFASVKKNGSDASLYKYQHEEIKDHYREAFWGAMDQLLDFLDANPSIGDYKDSQEYNLRQQLPVKNAREFDHYYGIGASSFFYHKVLYILRQAWRDIKAAIPADAKPELMELAAEALCYKVMAQAVMQFDVTELPRSIRWDYNHEYTKGTNPQTRERLYAQLTAHYTENISNIEAMKAAASGVSTMNFSNNKEDRKYYGVL